MKKLVLIAAALITAFTLVGCSSKQTETASIFDSKDTVIGFSALSSVMTLHESTSSEATVSNFTQLATTDTFEILSEIEELTPYLELVSTFMGNGSNFETITQASDLEDYEEMMVITTINMEGEEVSYTLYYNETIDMDVDEEDDEDEEENDFDEYDSVLEGIMIIEDVTYTLYGEREVEQGEETLELLAKLDDENYVTLDYGFENEEGETETEFIYEMFVNNQLVKSIEIEFEEDNEETELSLTFIRGTRESEYSFEVEVDGDTRKIEIEYKIVEAGELVEEGEAEVTIVTNAETGETVVRYEIESNGEQITYDDEDDDIENEEDQSNTEDDETDEEGSTV